MDKYEYNVKSDQIKKLYAKKDYETAAEIADSIDWSRVKNNSMLALVADAYEGTKQYDKARNVLEIAYERSPLGRQLAYRLTILSIRMRDFVAADQYYQEFAEMAPRDVAQYILKYRIARAKGEAIETLISILEAYVDVEMDERWQYELAKLYHEAGEDEKCVEMCDKIILWFSEGKYVTKALELKMRHQPLTEEQQAKYDGKWDYYNERIKAEESAAREKAGENESDGTADDEESASESSDEAQEDATSEADAENSADGEEGMAEDEESKNEPKPVKDILNDTTALDYLTDYSEDEKVINEPDTNDIDELTAMEVEMNLSKVVEESIESAKMDAQDISEIFGAEENETIEPEETTDNETEESEETSDEEIEEITDDEDEDEEYEDSEDDESDEEMELGDILSGEKEIIDDKLVEDEESEDMTDEEYNQTESDENQADISDESDKQTDVAESDDTEVTDDKADTEDKKNEASDEESDDKIEIYEFNEKKDGNAKGIGDELTKTAEIDIDEINVKVNSPENLYDTANIQKALAQSMQIIMKAESEKATRNAFAQSEIMDEPTKRIDISGGESGEKAEVQMENGEKYSSEEYAANDIEEKEEKKTGPVYETVPLPPIYDREEDGQIKIFEPDTEEEEQVDGQMSIEDVLLEFEKSKEEALKEAERKEKLAIEAAKKAAEEVALAKEAVRKALEEEAAAKTALAKASEVQKVIGDYTASKENPDGAEMLTQDLEAALAQIQETVTMEAMAEAATSMDEDTADTEIPEQEEVQNPVDTGETFETNPQEDEVPETDKEEEKEEDEPVSSDETKIADENETAASEEPESSEDNEEDEQSASLSDEDRKLFIEFLDIPGLEEQISATLYNLVNDFVEDGTSKTNNVIIMGDAKIGKTTLGLGIIKAANRGRKRPGRKVAKVKATALNKKGVGPAMSQILGTDLIIEQAGNLMPGTVVDLMAAMKSYTE